MEKERTVTDGTAGRLRGTLNAILFPLIAFAALGGLTWQIWGEVFRRWLVFEQSYSHGLLVFGVSLVLIARHLLRNRPVLAPSYPWLGALLGLLVIYLLGHALLIQAFQQLVLLPLFWSVLAVFWGWRQAKYFLIPLALIFFAMPIWETIRMPLQVLTAGVNHMALGLIGIEFVIDELFVRLPGIGIFEIARGCSGLNYLLVGLTLGALMGEQHHHGLKNRALLLIMAAGLSLLANWVRVLTIIYVGYQSNMEAALIDDHATFGWVVFAVSMVPLFWLGFRLAPGPLPGESNLRGAGLRQGATPLVLVLVLTGSSIVLVTPPSIADRAPSAGLTMSPFSGGDWAPLFRQKLNNWQPEVRNGDAQWVKTFAQQTGGAEKTTQSVLIGLYSYHYQRPGAELVQYGNNLYPRDRFKVEDRWEVSSRGETMNGLTLTNRVNSDRLHLVRVYRVNGEWYASAEGAKKAQLGSLFGGEDHAAVLVVGLDCGDCDPGAVLDELAGKVVPEAERALDTYYTEP